jgi:hypothetical protein
MSALIVPGMAIKTPQKLGLAVENQEKNSYA